MRPPNSPDTITDETRDSHNTFDTKFWDSFDVMLSCVFCWSQYLRVLILSCLSCSIAVIMVVTSTQTDRQSIYGVCHKWLNGALHGLWGIAARKLRHIRPHGNFMYSGVLWCLHPWCLSSIMNTSSMNDESSIVNPLSFPLDCQRINCGSLVLVARWRTVAFSQFCLQIALPYIKRAIASL